MSLDFRKLGHWRVSASQSDLEIQVNLDTTARLMLLSQFVPHFFLKFIINIEFAIYIMSTPTKWIVDDSKLVFFVTR